MENVCILCNEFCLAALQRADLVPDKRIAFWEGMPQFVSLLRQLLSAVLADAPRETENALAEYGYNLGIAFQMADDLFDYTLTTSDLGKKVGADLREGKLTLPVIHALGNASDGDREAMVKIIRNQDFSDDEFRILVGLLDKHDGLSYTREVAASYIDKAKKSLSIFESSHTKDIMIDIADYALSRRV